MSSKSLRWLSVATEKTIATAARIQRFAGYLQPPITITITSPGDNDYQELKNDSLYPTTSILSRTPSPRSSGDDYPPFLPSPVSRTASNEFQDVSDLVWLKFKVKNRTVFGFAYPRIIPKPYWNAGRRFINQRRRRCTKRQCLVFTVMVILLAIIIPIIVITHKNAIMRRGWGWGMPGMDENGYPIWEFKFDYLKYNYGGIKELVPKSENIPEYPPYDTVISHPETTISTSFAPSPTPVKINFYPDYDSEEYKQQYVGDYVPCRGFLDERDLDVKDPLSGVYEGIPFRKADAIIGSSTLLGLNNNICYERKALLEPYGFGENRTVKDDWKNSTIFSFEKVDWGELQNECLRRNMARFDPSPTIVTGFVPTPTATSTTTKDSDGWLKKRDSMSTATPEVDSTRESSVAPKYHPRTAVVLRCWETFKFLPDDIINLRRLITELSLYSGGEYAVHILVEIKNWNIPIWASESVYNETIERVVPEEFRNITVLANEPEMAMMYWGAEWYDSYRSLFMPLQVFSRRHPEYDFIWQWEMDMRYLGQHYHFLDSIAKWAKKQPRRELWERSARHYIPSIHGSWEDFSLLVHNLYKPNSTVWGPVLPVDVLPIEPDIPPTLTPEEDNYEWGVGEEADLITMLPLFDPKGGTWTLRHDCHGYKEEVEDLPRRSAIVTASRLSKRLIWRMHEENAQRGHACAAEMWPATNCLHHGLKAVYAPQPLWFEKDWKNMTYVDSVFNGGLPGTTVKESVYGEMEHNFSGLTWYFNTRWARRLYRNWMGWVDKTYETRKEGGGPEWDAEHGNMCVEGVLLHPIKDVRPSYPEDKKN